MSKVNDGGGHYFLFCDAAERWRGLRIYTDGRLPKIVDYDAEPEIESFVHLMPRRAREVPAQDYRIYWRNDGKLAVIQLPL